MLGRGSSQQFPTRPNCLHPSVRSGWNVMITNLSVGETGASCYNFHSKSIFHTNMQAQDFLLTWSCNVTSLLSQIRRIPLLYHVTKKLSVISHETSTVTTSPIYGASCYSMWGNILQRHVLPLLVLHTHILCIVVILSSCILPILFWTHSWTIHN